MFLPSGLKISRDTQILSTPNSQELIIIQYVHFEIQSHFSFIPFTAATYISRPVSLAQLSHFLSNMFLLHDISQPYKGDKRLQVLCGDGDRTLGTSWYALYRKYCSFF